MSSGVELFTEPNQDVLITAQLPIDATGLYPQAVIYDIQNLTTAIDTIDLDEVDYGSYAKKWTNPGELTKYWVRVFIYTDSGHTALSAFDRPGDISINVGRYQGGGYLGGATGGKVVRARLTEEEIKAIAEAVKDILKPELDKKSEFDPKKDEVITKIDNSDVINEIKAIKIPEVKIPEVKIPEFPKIPEYNEEKVIKEVLKAIKEIKISDYSNNFKEIRSLIKSIDISEPKINGVDLLLEPLKYYLLLMSINENSNPASVFKGIKELNGIYKKKAFLELLKYPDLAKQVAKL